MDPQIGSSQPTQALGINPSKVEWDLTNGPLSKLLEPLYRYSGLGVCSVSPVGDFLESIVIFSDGEQRMSNHLRNAFHI